MDTSALDQQIMVLESRGDWQGALAALVERVNRVTDPGEKTRTLEHMVSVYRVKLRDEAGAVRATEALLSVTPDHPGALAYLREAYTQRGDGAKLQALDAHIAAQHHSGNRGFLGNVGSQVTGALGAAAATAGAAAAGVFHAVTSAPVAYAQPGGGHTGGAGGVPVQSQGYQGQGQGGHRAAPVAPVAPVAPATPKCGYCGADLGAGVRACQVCGGEV